MQAPEFFRQMTPFSRAFAVLAVTLSCGFAPVAAGADSPRHGIAMAGDPALPADFTHLPYANPEAPKGGRIRFGESGGFDSTNPFIRKGRAVTGVTNYTVETLMARSLDEPFTLYGLLAESIQTDDARSYVEFTLRPEAHFSDGNPVTVEDVIWSYETLGTVGVGAPRYLGAWSKVAKIEQTGPRSLRITFNAPDREMPLLMGLRPVLEKAQWEGKDFAEAATVVPIGSGPYTIDTVDMGRTVVYKRDPNWWGKDLPFNQGLHNFDEVRFDYFGDGGVVFEAFKAGELDSWREVNAAKWARDFSFPAVTSGAIVKAEIPHSRPSGITGLVFNTRKPIFADWRVREALTLAFNFEFINATLNNGVEPRITSYFSNSDLAMGNGPATGKVAELLAPYAAELIPGTLEGYDLPVSDGSELNRGNTRKAIKLLTEAGWTADAAGILRNAAGQPFDFEILLAQGASETQQVVDIYVEALRRLGITPRIETVDNAQFIQRTNAYNFDMSWVLRSLSLSPGNEQNLYWNSAGVNAPDSRNVMGVNQPAVDAMITKIVTAENPEDYKAAVQALDRLLTAGRYVIPIWYSKVSRLAYARDLHYPDRLPLYGDWPGFQPDVWWFEAEK